METAVDQIQWLPVLRACLHERDDMLISKYFTGASFSPALHIARDQIEESLAFQSSDLQAIRLVSFDNNISNGSSGDFDLFVPALTEVFAQLYDGPHHFCQFEFTINNCGQVGIHFWTAEHIGDKYYPILLDEDWITAQRITTWGRFLDRVVDIAESAVEEMKLWVRNRAWLAD